MNHGVLFDKFTLNSSQRKLKGKDIWHLLTVHDSITLSLNKFEKAFEGGLSPSKKSFYYMFQ